MCAANIKVLYKPQIPDVDADINLSQISKATSNKIAYDNVAPKKPYKQREGERETRDDDGPEILANDYPQFVEESRFLDANLSSFEAYEQIYEAFRNHQDRDKNRIMRKFGHSQILAMDHKKRLLKTFGSQGTSVTSKHTSIITKRLVKKYSPKGAHMTGLMGGQSEETQVAAAQKRLQKSVENKIKVNVPAVNKYIREVTLNDKYRGTWVAEGLNDNATKGCLAKRIKQRDLISEILDADVKADEWLEEHRQTQNQAYVCKDPPLDLGKYFNDYCNRNPVAYGDYKQYGIKELANAEKRRHEKKIIMQEEAEIKGIAPSKML